MTKMRRKFMISRWSTPYHFYMGIRSGYNLCCVAYFCKHRLIGTKKIAATTFERRTSLPWIAHRDLDWPLRHVLCDKCYDKEDLNLCL